MAVLTESTTSQTEYLKLRHKYLNGSGELIEGVAGILSTGTFPDTNFNCVVTAKGTLTSPVASGALRPSLNLRSASEAAQFRTGDTVSVFTTATGAVAGAVMTVQSVKGQQVILNTAPTADYAADDLVVRFATGAVGGGTSSTTDASAGLPYVGAGDVVAYLQAVQNNITASLYNTDLVLDVDADADGAAATDEGIYSKFTSALTINAAAPRSMEGDLLTFSTEPAALVGCTARIMSHATGATAVLTVGDIRDSNGTFLGNQFPVVTTAAHSGGAGTGVTPTTGTTYALTCGIADAAISKIMESTAVPPTDKMGQENSNNSGAISVLINAVFDVIQKLDPDAVAGELVPADLEESLFGAMVGQGSAQGKRLRLAADAAADATSITVERDNAINDIPFPLSGTVRLQNNCGTDNNQGTAVVNLSADLTYTRTKRSNVLTLGAVTGIALKTGDIVELLPAHGQIMKGYASQLTGQDIVGLISTLRTCVSSYALPTMT